MFPSRPRPEPPVLDRVALPCAGRTAGVRELTGEEERAAVDATTASALALLDRVLEPGSGAAADLTAADRDRLLLAIQRRTFGDRVDATVSCRACRAPFDLDFTLGGLEAALEPGEPVAGLRLPTGADELAVADLAPERARAALLDRCVLDDALAPELDALLARAAPLADLELDAECPECGEAQPVHFDIQSFLMGSLMAERPRLLADVHCLALTYRWSPEDILALPRGERRALVELIDLEARRA
jgi:hypothetical protein